MTDLANSPESSDTITIRHEDPTNCQFNRHISGCDANLFLSPTWLGALAATYGFTFDAVVAQSGYGTSAVPYSVIDDARGRRVRSLPFSDAAMFPLAHPSHWPAIEAELAKLDAPVSLAIRPGSVPLDPTAWDISEPWVWHQVDSTGGDDDLMARYSGKIRNRIRRSAKEGFEVRFRNDPEAIDSYFDLHLGVRRSRHSLLAQPRQLFVNIADAFWGPDRLEPDLTDGTVVTVERDGEVAAACVVARYGRVAYYKFSASLPEYRRLYVNKTLVYGATRWARDSGCDVLDLGRSDVDQPGLIRFKDEMAGVKQPLMRAVMPGPENPTGAELGATLGRLTTLLCEPGVPDSVLEAAGAELYRYFA